MASALLWLLPGLPLAAGALLLVTGRRADAIAAPVGVAVATASVVLAVAAAVVRPSAHAPFLAGLPFGMAVDGLSAAMVVTVTSVTAIVLGYGTAEIGPGQARARYVGLMLLFAGAMLVTVAATSLLSLLLGWEVMGATSYALIGFWWRDEWRARAGTTAFVTTRTADLGLYLAAGAAFAGAGTLDLARLPELPAPWLHLTTAGILVAAAGKSAQLPFSFWLSRAMAGPSSVSALLHSAAMVAAGGYLLLRLEPLLAAAGWAAHTAAWLGALTALALGAVACVQRELKQLLAASTCAQIGFLVLAAGVGSVVGGATHLAGHAAVKSLLFLAAGAWLTTVGTDRLTRLRGAGARMPLVGIPFAVGALALAGVPPLTLWTSKEMILADAPAALVFTALAASALSALYAGRALVLALDVTTPRQRPTRAVPRRMSIAVLALLPPAALLGFVANAARPTPLAPEPYASGLAAVIPLAGVVAAAVWQRRGTPAPRTVAETGRQWLHLETLALRFAVTPTMRVAGAAARFDDQIVTRTVDSVARAGERAARLADDGPERSLTRAIAAVTASGRWLGRIARRPQTGQLHHYYAQAAVGIVVLVLLAVLTTVVLAG